jgi:hypothetical protein
MSSIMSQILIITLKSGYMKRMGQETAWQCTTWLRKRNNETRRGWHAKSSVISVTGLAKTAVKLAQKIVLHKLRIMRWLVMDIEVIESMM